MPTQILRYFKYFDASLHAILDSLHISINLVLYIWRWFCFDGKLVIEMNLPHKYSIIVHSIDYNTPVVLILCSCILGSKV